jgi:hypothetical protein
VEWGFIWLMVVLKIPIIALLLLVWWAWKQEPDYENEGDDGGSKTPAKPRHPRPARPNRRGPHGDPAPLPSPARVRTTAVGRERVDR